MKAILTSSFGGSIKVDGRRMPIPLIGENGQLDKIKAFWRKNSRVLLISSSPDDYNRNDEMINCFRESFRMSGLSFSLLAMCDSRTEENVERGWTCPNAECIYGTYRFKRKITQI